MGLSAAFYMIQIAIWMLWTMGILLITRWYYKQSGTEEVHKVPFKKLAARLWEDTVGAREKFMHIYLGGLSDAELNRLLTKLADLISKRLIRKQQTLTSDSISRAGGEDNTSATGDKSTSYYDRDTRGLLDDRL